MLYKPDPGTPPESARVRPRGRWMAFVTIIVAAGYLWATDVALNSGDRWGIEWDGLRRTNSARALLMLNLPPVPSPTESPRPRLGGLLPFGPALRPGPTSETSEITAEQREIYRRRVRETAAVEGAAYVWERAMWGLCGLLGAVAVLSWMTPWGRGWHLLGGGAILLVTLFSLACLRYLEVPEGGGSAIWPLKPQWHAALAQRWNIPEGGGLPPLPARTYLTFSTLLSAYGWLLVGVFLRKWKSDPPIDTALSGHPESAGT